MRFLLSYLLAVPLAILLRAQPLSPGSPTHSYGTVPSLSGEDPFFRADLTPQVASADSGYLGLNIASGLDNPNPLPNENDFGAEPFPPVASADTGYSNVITTGLDSLSGVFSFDTPATQGSSDALYAAAARKLANGCSEGFTNKLCCDDGRTSADLNRIHCIPFREQDACRKPTNLVCCANYHLENYLLTEYSSEELWSTLEYQRGMENLGQDCQGFPIQIQTLPD